MGRQDVLAFWFGESSRPTPSFVCEAAIASLRAGQTFYTENLGRPYLRQALATYLTQLHGRRIAQERIAVTGSGVSALMIVNQLLIEPGDRVVAVTPLWPNAVEIPKVVGAEVTSVPLKVREGRWSLHLDELLAVLTPKTRMLILNSPNNPTGWTLRPEEQRAIFAHCRRRGIWILADDAYERLVYVEGMRSAPSFLALAEDRDRVIGVNSFSKAWCMTGWRAGWIVAPPSVMPELMRLIEYNTSCVPEFVQRAATAALEQGHAYVTAMRAELAASKGHLVAGLRALPGIEAPDPEGAMYVLLRIAGHRDSLRLAKRLIAEVGLGLAPGRAFGAEAEGWLRWCYASEPQKIEAGLKRLARFLSK